MSVIKKFFEKRKLNAKFKEAGSGQQLNAPSSRPVQARRQASAERCPTSSSAAQAGNAALARFEAQRSQSSKMPTSSATTWKSGSMGREEVSEEVNVNVKPRTTNIESVPIDDNILYCCPLCPVTLPRNEIFTHLHQCFLQELSAEPLMISVTMIHTLNRDSQKVEACINVLCKYLQNIIDNPSEEKYLRIRKTNRVFQEKVASLLGVEEFLVSGCGFTIKQIPFEVAGETSDHEFYVLNESLAQDQEQLSAAKQMLTDAEPLDITIDRNIRVFKPSSSASHIVVPPSFYEMSTAEVKQKQSEMTTDVEKSKQLRTKAMREGETAPKRIYKYCIIRIRFPDGILLQGTFSSAEKLLDLKQFIQEHLAMDWLPFTIVDSIGRPYSEETATLTKLKLTPGSLVNFNIEPNISEEVAASSPGGRIQFLRDEFMALIQVLT